MPAARRNLPNLTPRCSVTGRSADPPGKGVAMPFESNSELPRSHRAAAPLRALLLAGVSAGALGLAAGGTAVQAATYTAFDETSLVAAIDQANADGDASSTITLGGNVALAAPSLLPTITKSLTINTGAYTLSATGHTIL